MTLLSSRPRRRAVAVGLLALAFTIAAPAAATTGDDPNLQQTVEADQPVVDDRAELTAGHVDLGPRFVDGRWTLLFHDDVAKGTPGGASVWRTPEATTVRVADAARLPVPDDPAYGFLGVAAGTDVWVLPQTQNTALPWLGWNTQDPGVMDRIDRGVTLRLEGVQGPGRVVTYLQSGTFGAPDVLWDSDVNGPQDLYVDVNTHTHANWVFTEPGIYLMQLTAEATLVDGSAVSDTQVLRFTVGDQARADDALAASYTGAVPAAGPDAASSDGSALETALLIAIGVVGTLVVLGVIAALVRLRGERRRALTGPAA